MARKQSLMLQQLSKSSSMLENFMGLRKAIQGQDVIRVDVPLFLRLLEWSREDAKQDADLHSLAEKLTELCKDGDIARMRDYEKLVPEKPDDKDDDENQDKQQIRQPQPPAMMQGAQGMQMPPMGSAQQQ